MSSFSYIFGLTSTIFRITNTLHIFFIYYRNMKISVLPNFEIDQKYLSKKSKIYKDIFYFLMSFLYFSNIDINESLFYFNSIINTLCFLGVLNMYLFSIKNQNQMLLQTLFIFIIYQILNRLYFQYIIDLLFISSCLLRLQKPINRLRMGILKNEMKYFRIEESVIEMSISFFWLLYALGYNIICFIIILLLSLFFRICIILGFEIVGGKIGKDSIVYKFLINIFLIKVNSIEKSENNII